MPLSEETHTNPFAEQFEEYDIERWSFVLPSGHQELVGVVVGKDKYFLTDDKDYQTFELVETKSTIRVPLRGTLVRMQRIHHKKKVKKLNECAICSNEAEEGSKLCAMHGG